MIEPQIDKLLACLRLDGTDPVEEQRRLEEAVAGLAEIGDLDPDRISAAIAAAFGRQFGVRITPGHLRDEELAAATDLARSKYQSADWTERPLPEMAGKTTRTR